MRITCTECTRTARPTPAQAEAARHVMGRAEREFLCGCPECRRFTRHRIESEPDDSRPSRAPGLSFRCPVAGCTGWLAFVERHGLEGAHHRCARCSSVWFSTESLENEIAKICELYPYRMEVYARVGGRYAPKSVLAMPEDYEARVRQEPDGRTQTHVRG